MQIRDVFGIALAEMRSDRRLARTWLFIVLAYVFSIAQYFQVNFLFEASSGVSPVGGMLLPSAMAIDLMNTQILLYTFAIIFLSFDILSRDKRDRIVEVLHSKPISNVEFLLGRILGVVILFYIPVAIFAILLLLAGVASIVTDAAVLSRGPTIMSIITVLVFDIGPNLFLFASLVVLLTLVVRLRVFAALLAIGIVVFQIWIFSRLPISMLDLVSFTHTSFNFLSEITAEFITLDIFLNRVGVVALGICFLCLAAVLYPRLDGGSKMLRLQVATAAFVVTCLSFSAIYYRGEVQDNDVAEWRSAHMDRANAPAVDVRDISGSVVIDPGSEIEIDLELAILNDHTAPLGELVFALNPDLSIDTLTLDGAEVEHSFENGLLVLSLPGSATLAVQEQAVLRIEANGKPNPLFAYLDSPLNARSDDFFSGAMLVYLGIEHAVMHRNYVTLMPEQAWYPQAGAHVRRDRISLNARDFFSVDLTVALPDDWLVAGPGRREELASDEGSLHRIASKTIVPEIGLFASEFVSKSIEINGINFELLVTEDHDQNLALFDDIVPLLEEQIGDVLDRGSKVGLTYPYESLALVEIPNGVRLYGGGWRMDTVQVLPGVVTMRESSFPKANFKRWVDQAEQRDLDEEALREYKLELLVNYFENDVLGGNVIFGGLRQFLTFQTEPTGSGAEALAYTIEALGNEYLARTTSFFSPYLTASQAQFQQIVQTTMFSAMTAGEGDPNISAFLKNWIVDRASVWEDALKFPLAELPLDEDPEQAFYILVLKGDAIANSILNSVGTETVGQFLADLRNQSVGGSYTLADVTRIGLANGIDFQAIAGDFLHETRIAGFIPSVAHVTRLPDEQVGLATFETSLYVKNAEPVPGVFEIWYEFGAGEWRADDAYSEDTTRPITVPGNSSVAVNIYTNAPTTDVRLRPFFSLNRKPVQVEIANRRNWPTEDREPRAQVIHGVSWEPPEVEGIVVDDLDEGFSVEKAPEPPAFLMALLNFATGFNASPSTDQGIPEDREFRISGQGGSTQVSVSFSRDWKRRATTQAFGAYRKTTAVAVGGQGGDIQRAFFDAELPHNGTWKLEYHLPATSEELNGRKRRGNASQNNYRIFVEQGDQSESIDFDASIASGGWNELGRFDITESRVRVVVYNISSGSVTFADAIRWLPVS